MKKAVVFCLFLLILSGISVNAQNNQSINIILFDVSGSMVGNGDGQGINIFANVKEVAFQIIRNMEEGTYLVILPFDRGIRSPIFEILIKSQQNADAAIQFLSRLIANGSETWMTKSFENATEKLFSLKKSIEKFDDKNQEILIFTDGRGNHAYDEKIENFIKIYDLRKTDFPHLFTKFFAYGEIFSKAEIERLKEKKIPVIQTERVIAAKLDYKPSVVNILKNKIFIYANQPEFEVKFRFPEKTENAPLKAKIKSDVAGKTGTAFELFPTEFTLSGLQKFRVSIASDINFLDWMKQEKLIQVEGEFIITSDSNIIFHPDNHVEFIFALKAHTIKLEEQEIKPIKNEGGITFKYNSSSTEGIKIRLKARTQNFDRLLNFQVDPEEEVITQKGKLNIRFSPENEKKYLEYRKALKDVVEGELILMFEPKTPNVIFDPKEISVPIIVTPYVNYLPYILAVIIVVLALLGLFLFFKIKTANFPLGSQLVDSNGKTHALRSRFGKGEVTIGKGKKSDIKCYKLALNDVFMEIKPIGLDIIVSKINSQVHLLDSSGNDRDTVKCTSGDSFEIQDSSGGSETYIYQKI